MKIHGMLWGALALAIAALSWGSFSQAQEPAHQHGEAANAQHEHMWANIKDAIAVIVPTQGNEAHGWVRFTQEGQAVKVVAEVEGLAPNTTHGFHIHEFGDCSAADGSSAGGHYNPEGHTHAGPATKERHAGDLGNITADANGKARLELTADNFSIAGMKNPIIGRSVVIHAKADDLQTQPTGNAGARIACGVIGIAKPPAPPVMK